jgi:phosphatidylglycerol lysyltransferase
MSWLARLLDLPGWAADLVWGGGVEPEGLRELSVQEAAPQVAASPRANAFLALEQGLRRFEVGGRVFATRLSGRNAFIIGGLHGPRAGASEALAELRDRLRVGGCRRVLLIPVASDEVALAEGAGFQCTQVASEALIDLEGFTLDGRARADLRQMCNRGRRRFGLEFRELDPAAEGAAWSAVYQRWLESRPVGHSMGLLVGRPNLDRPLGRRYVATWDPAGRGPVAVVSLTPGWSGRGYGVDIMARLPEGPPGAMDMLLAETSRMLAAEGVERLSLGAAPMSLAGGGGPPSPPHLRRFVGFMFRSPFGNGLFPFRQLFRFKDKLAPRWEPVCLASWPRVGLWPLYVSARLWGLFGSPP